MVALLEIQRGSWAERLRRHRGWQGTVSRVAGVLSATRLHASTATARPFELGLGRTARSRSHPRRRLNQGGRNTLPARRHGRLRGQARCSVPSATDGSICSIGRRTQSPKPPQSLSVRYLEYTRQLAASRPDSQIAPQAVAQLPWGISLAFCPNRTRSQTARARSTSSARPAARWCAPCDPTTTARRAPRRCTETAAGLLRSSAPDPTARSTPDGTHRRTKQPRGHELGSERQPKPGAPWLEARETIGRGKRDRKPRRLALACRS